MFDSMAKLEKTLTRVSPLRGQGRALWLGAMVGAVGLAIAFGIARMELEASRHVFEERLRSLQLALQAHLEAPVEALRTLPPYFMASSSVERQELADYVASALRRHPAIEYFAWAPDISEPERANFERRARQVGWPGYRIWQLDPEGVAEPAAPRKRHVALLHVEPPKPELTGFDLTSDPAHRQAIVRALRTDNVVGVPALEGGESSEGALTLYAPVAALRTRDSDPRVPRRGVALMTLRIGPLVAASLTPADAEEIDLELRDSHGRIMFSSGAGPADGAKPADHESELEFAGLDWTARYFAKPGVVSAGTLPWIAVGLGLLVALGATLAAGTLEVTRRINQELRMNQKLGPYKLVRKLGEGGMGTVYEAEHALLRRPTAIKVISPNVRSDTFQERFEREVTLTSQLSHPNTIAVYDFGRTREGVFYYSMEFLSGTTIADLVRREGALPPARAVHLLRQICGSLGEAHALGLVHRDIKPSNLMVCERGGVGDFVKVLDFGLAKAMHQSTATGLTQDGSMLGTPLYMAPELFEQPPRPSPASDLYAVGAVAYLMLTGTEMFSETSLPALMARIVNRDPERPSVRLGQPLPGDLESVVMACLQKAPEQRPASAAALRAQLAACDVPVWSEEQAHRAWQHTASLAAAQPRASTPEATADTLAIDSGEHPKDALPTAEGPTARAGARSA